MSYPPAPDDKVQDAIEDLLTRDAEWYELDRPDTGTASEGRIVFMDGVHRWIRMEGPKWQVGARGKARNLRPY